MGAKAWTPEEVNILVEHYPHHYAKDVAKMLGIPASRVYHKANLLGIKKSREWQHRELQLQGARLRIAGKNARFQKGLVPHNTGKPWQKWMSPEGRKNSLTTAFYKGHAPHNTKYDGCVVTRRDTTTGREYKYIRLEKGKWMLLQRVVWIFLNGPIQADKILRCLTEDTLNCDPSNWFLTDRRTNLAKNSGRETMSDKYIALVLARRDPQLRDALMKMPEILDLKRTELSLKKTIDGIAC
jgi:hypothetical protein